MTAMPAGEAIRADRDVYVLETRGAMYFAASLLLSRDAKRTLASW